MVFSSLPLYHLDPQNWHQQSNDQQLLVVHHPTHHHDSTVQLPPPPPPQQQPPPSHGGGSGGGGSIKPNSMVDRARQAQIPLPEAGLKCPRCESTNTKFCYFNNYSLSQPRHFCKTCRRYWTRGGALRSVPVGGGSRRTTKRSKSKNISNNSNSSCSNSSSISNNNGLRSAMITNSTNLEGGSSCSTGLFLNPNNLPQLPFLPSSLHHLGNPNPSGIGLSLLGARGAEMEFPLMGGFEGLGRINGIHPFENSTSSNNNNASFELLGGRLINNHHALQSKPLDLHHEFMIDRVASVKLEESHQGLNLSKDFALIHQGNDNNQYNWENDDNNNNNNVWTNSDLSGFTSSNNHLLG